MAAILDFTRNAITKVSSGHTPVLDIYGTHQSLILLLFYKKNDINLLFHLAQIVAILDYINNAMSKVLSDYITMSVILLKILSFYCFILYKWGQMAAIFDFDIFRRLEQKIILGS